MDEQIVEIARSVVSRAPEWVRQDLVSKDAAVRIRAEEALAAMIAAALATAGEALAAPGPTKGSINP